MSFRVGFSLLFAWTSTMWAASVPIERLELAAPIAPEHFRLAASYSRAHAGVGLRVEQYGRLVAEDYARGFSAGEAHKIYSGTKNFVALAALMAQQDGLLNLDEPASKTLTEWQHDRRRAITIAELLSQTSGLAPSADLIGSSRDQMAAAVRARPIDPPGARFHYGPAGYQAFGEILRRKLRTSGRSVEGYLRDRIFTPLGIDIPYWARDRAGHPLLHAGLALTAGDWAKLGNYIVRELHSSRKQLVSRQLLDRLFVGHRANPAYGISFWLNRPPPRPRLQKMTDLQPAMDGEQLYAGGPRDLYAAEGTAKQRLYIIPSLSLVIVRFGEGGRFSDGDFLSRLLTGKPQPDARSH